ncbi:MAG: hypothetical protein K8L99_14545 [Anaerolineae bacterium]|nr:hypothetical protein [Anaerolineae bacterium]
MGSSTAYWYVTNKIIFVHNVGDLTADNFHQVDRQIIDFMRAAQEQGVEKVHVFVDCTEMRRLPPIGDLEGGRILKYMVEPNCGWSIVVGYRNNPFLSILSRLLTSVMGVDLYMADTLPKATTLLKQIEPTLPELPEIETWKQNHITLPQDEKNHSAN